MARDFSQIRSVLATDCGSTTTKAILIERQPDGTYRLVTRGEAPTTVEAPFEDVTVGVINSVTEVEELRKRKLLDNGRILTPQNGDEGVDIYISTSSAGGGLQMVVTGVVKSMTAESAQRAALGAGAIVMDVLAQNDDRQPHEKIERIRQLRPDMILMSGGIDGGTITHVVEIAELLSAANPRPRLGIGYNLPVIYAGNKDARSEIVRILGEKVALKSVDNLRPVLERENLGPARTEIHELFMEHVMAQAPGYKKLMEWTDAPIMPTPGAVGLIIQTVSRRMGINVVGVDIGGATTDVFSVFSKVFNRTVSANLGMSYSVSNVLAEAGVDNILRWVPFDMDAAELRNRIGNKMIRPTTIPQALEELQIEQAISREALRLAFVQHKSFAVGLKGVQRERTISEAFEQSASGDTLVKMMDLAMIVGSGGVLSHAPRRSQAMLMMIDAFEPQGATELVVDSIFMAPHLGVLSTVNEKAATDVFDRDCLVRLGTCIAPVPAKKTQPGADAVRVALLLPDGSERSVVAKVGDLLRVPVPYVDGKRTKARIEPAKHFDCGQGAGVAFDAELNGGVVGIVVDARGRPLQMPADQTERLSKLAAWNQAMELYSK